MVSILILCLLTIYSTSGCISPRDTLYEIFTDSFLEYRVTFNVTENTTYTIHLPIPISPNGIPPDFTKKLSFIQGNCTIEHISKVDVELLEINGTGPFIIDVSLNGIEILDWVEIKKFNNSKEHYDIKLSSFNESLEKTSIFLDKTNNTGQLNLIFNYSVVNYLFFQGARLEISCYGEINNGYTFLPTNVNRFNFD